MTEPTADRSDADWRAAMAAVPFSGDHADCAEHLRRVMAAGGVEVTVRAASPLIASHWARGMTCPHGTTYWLEPTSEQRATWDREGTP